ncbi:MAG: hypothetical protein V7756_09690 [Halopseudomonas sp.]|uniref:hypothetical protein n=1 Tax=Halopseudomonas sp. TaxID=2901191 RepID=UPI003002FDC6
MKTEQTCRGFDIATFKDRYGASCSLQKSSLGSEDAIWFGVDDPEPKIMASQAAAFGVDAIETTGWVPYPLPKEVLLNTRMHLTRDQVSELLPALQRFAATGELTK